MLLEETSANRAPEAVEWNIASNSSPGRLLIVPDPVSISFFVLFTSEVSGAQYVRAFWGDYQDVFFGVLCGHEPRVQVQNNAVTLWYEPLRACPLLDFEISLPKKKSEESAVALQLKELRQAVAQLRKTTEELQDVLLPQNGGGLRRDVAQLRKTTEELQDVLLTQNGGLPRKAAVKKRKIKLVPTPNFLL